MSASIFKLSDHKSDNRSLVFDSCWLNPVLPHMVWKDWIARAYLSMSPHPPQAVQGKTWTAWGVIHVWVTHNLRCRQSSHNVKWLGSTIKLSTKNSIHPLREMQMLANNSSNIRKEECQTGLKLPLLSRWVRSTGFRPVTGVYGEQWCRRHNKRGSFSHRSCLLGWETCNSWHHMTMRVRVACEGRGLRLVKCTSLWNSASIATE